MRYDGKVTLITGGSHGIGRGCVQVFVGAGSTVVFCSRNEKEGKAVEAEVNASGPGSATWLCCDVSDEAEVRHLVDETVRQHDRLDCLINSAGWHPLQKPIDEFTTQDFRDLLELNLVSMFVACQQALPHLRRSRGNIINMSTLVGSMGQPHATTHVATKGGITAFTKALAIDEAAHGVRVNSVSPGNIWTPIGKEAVDASLDPEKPRQDGEAARRRSRPASTTSSPAGPSLPTEEPTRVARAVRARPSRRHAIRRTDQAEERDDRHAPDPERLREDPGPRHRRSRPRADREERRADPRRQRAHRRGDDRRGTDVEGASREPPEGARR